MHKRQYNINVIFASHCQSIKDIIIEPLVKEFINDKSFSMS